MMHRSSPAHDLHDDVPVAEPAHDYPSYIPLAMPSSAKVTTAARVQAEPVVRGLPVVPEPVVRMRIDSLPPPSVGRREAPRGAASTGADDSSELKLLLEARRPEPSGFAMAARNVVLAVIMGALVVGAYSIRARARRTTTEVGDAERVHLVAPAMAESRAAAVSSAANPPGSSPEAAPARDVEAAGRERFETQVALEMGDVVRAERVGQAAVAHDPSEADGWLLLAAAQLQLRRTIASRASLKACVDSAAHGPRWECAALLRDNGP